MIHKQDDSGQPREFLVRVGHYSVRVAGRDGRSAIVAARQRLCDEMPRMWDVITRLENRRFLVQALPNRKS